MKNKYLNEAFPMYHLGYMTGKDVFSLLIIGNYLDALESYIEKENICILSEELLKTFYRRLMLDQAALLSDDWGEKARMLGNSSREGYGLYRIILDYTHWDLMAGSFAYDLFSTIYSEKEIYKCTAAQLPGGRILLLDFLEAESVEELARIVRYSAYKLAGTDITGINPQIHQDKIKAVRPPCDEWGLIIYR